MRLIVTRPRREAANWVRDLQAAGWEALALPLIEVGPAPDPVPLARAWALAADCAALMFVSANAVRYFFEAKPLKSLVFIGDEAIKTRAWATGPGTAEALLSAGVAPQLIDGPDARAAQMDSEALWQVVGPGVVAGSRVLIVRGRDRDQTPSSTADAGVGREWLAERLRAAGAHVEFVVAYERGRPVFSREALELAAQAARDGSLWLFSSAEAVANLGACLPGADWRQACALATHPRIASAAQSLGFGQVRVTRAGLANLLASIESGR